MSRCDGRNYAVTPVVVGVVGFIWMLCASSAFAQNSPSGLVSYWNFDEGTGRVLNDSVGANDGNIQGATWTPEGKFGGALYFDGTDDYVSVQTSSLSLGKLTVSAWLKATSYNSSLTFVNALSSESRMNGWSFYMNCANGDGGIATAATKRVFFHAYSGYSWTAGHGCWGGYYGLGEWVHLVMTHDGKSLKGYVNGKLMAVNDNAAGDVAASSYVGIGGSCVYGVWGQFFHGLIDEVRIYDHALSGDEVFWLYGQGAGDCRGTMCLVSDTATEWWDGSAWRPSVVTWNYSKWIRTPDSKWIWSSYLVDSMDKFGPFTFRRTFTIPEGAYDVSGTMTIAADNAYKLYLNGKYVMGTGIVTSPPPSHAEAPPYEYWPPRSGVDICTIVPTAGVNEITIEAVNYSDPVDAYANPAGLDYEAYIAYTIPTTNYYLVVDVTGSGSVSPKSGSYAYAAGTTVTLTASPGLGSRLAGWIGDVPDGAVDSNTLTVVMNRNRKITAEFEIIPPVADLRVSKSSSCTSTCPGSPFAYTVIVRNAGPDPATGVRVTDLLPRGVGLDYAIAVCGTYCVTSGVWTVGNLGVGEQAVLRMNVQVDTPVVISATRQNANTSWCITNVASISAVDQDDPEGQDNIDFVTVTVAAPVLDNKTLIADININPNNRDDYEFLVVLPDGRTITRADLGGDFDGYAGPAVGVHVKPKGEGGQTNLSVNGESFTLMNSDAYDIQADSMTVDIHKVKLDGRGKSLGQWWISIAATNAGVLCVRSDRDKDGASDWSEWIAGTCATNMRDTLVIENVQRPSATEAQVSCKTSAGRLYSLESTTNLIDASSWQAVFSTTGDNESVVFTNKPGSGKTFYRIKVSQP